MSKRKSVDSIWKRTDLIEHLNRKNDSKLYRFHDIDIDPGDSETWSTQNVQVDDHILFFILKSGISDTQRFSWWSLNFLSKGYLNKGMLSTDRAAKTERNEVWHYIIWSGIELHGQERSKGNLERVVNSKTRAVTSRPLLRRRCIIQNDDPPQEDIPYTIELQVFKATSYKRYEHSNQFQNYILMLNNCTRMAWVTKTGSLSNTWVLDFSFCWRWALRVCSAAQWAWLLLSLPTSHVKGDLIWQLSIVFLKLVNSLAYRDIFVSWSLTAVQDLLLFQLHLEAPRMPLTCTIFFVHYFKNITGALKSVSVNMEKECRF